MSAVGTVVTGLIGGSLGGILSCGAWKRWKERLPGPDAEALAAETPPVETPMSASTAAPRSASKPAPKSAAKSALPAAPDDAPKGPFFARPADAGWPPDAVEGH